MKPFLCPECGCHDTVCRRTKHNYERRETIRERRCVACGCTVRTVERAEDKREQVVPEEPAEPAQPPAPRTPRKPPPQRKKKPKQQAV